VQLDATIRTVSTFSFGAFELDEPEVAPVVAELDGVDGVDDELSRVPVISTLWPMCGVSFASSASRR
jgi:hypothetical protein